MDIKVNDITLHVQGEQFEIESGAKRWCSDVLCAASIILKNGRSVLFESAKQQSQDLYETGCGKGVKTSYRDIKGVNFAFDTLIWIEFSTSVVHFEWTPINEQGFDIEEVVWPAPFVSKNPQGCTLIPYMQGVMLMNDDPNTWGGVPFNGQLCSAAAYMPWLSQIDSRNGYIMINTTPWDARYVIDHRGDSVGTSASMRWLPSLGAMRYRRTLEYIFHDDCDYNDICKLYRNHVKERGRLVTLAQKSIQNPSIHNLIGSAFVHTGIKIHIEKESRFYEMGNGATDTPTTFDAKCKRLMEYKKEGIDKLYIHIDGWGSHGYDNNHPDILPPCEEAGGYEGMKRLQDTLEDMGYMWGLHDQYRDYYHTAATYQKKQALQNADGSYTQHALWAGGTQNYLCTKQAIHYVKRNIKSLQAHGIHPSCSYLDAFTCNELDECNNPAHRMTRKECADARSACFQYVLSNGILSSSEECVDWAIPSLVFAHYGPYEWMMKKDNERIGIPLPLFNLVYHECVILPWPMERRTEDYMLYALLNGGAAYLEREGVYPNTDGAFEEEHPMSLAEKKGRYEVVAKLQERVATLEMVSHTLLEGTHKQRSVFADGTSVTIDLHKGTYLIAFES